MRLCFLAILPRVSSSDWEKTFPMGLWGVLSRIIRVRAVILASSISVSRRHADAGDVSEEVAAGGLIGTYTGTPPFIVILD